MQKDIHPQYETTTVTCTCGNTFTTKSTKPDREIRAEVCSNCHPFYTGTQKLIDAAGRVDRFRKRYGDASAKADKKAAAAPKAEPKAAPAAEATAEATETPQASE